MSNPQAEVNLQKFKGFVSKRESECDWEDFVLPNKTGLNKKMVARECGFDRKRITGNKKIFALWHEISAGLLTEGILNTAPRTPSEKFSASKTAASNSVEKRQAKKQQEVNAAMEEELYQTKQELACAKRKLEKLQNIEEYMLATGRM